MAAGKTLNLFGATSGSTSLVATAVAGATTITLPAITGTLITTADTGTVTNIMLAGSIANTKLANSTISGIALGSNLAALTMNNSGTGAASGSTYTGAAAVTISYNSIGAQPAFTSQTANQFYAAPNGSAGVPGFRAIVAADLPAVTNVAGGTTGALVYQTGAGTTGFITAVATGQVLASAGVTTVPAWTSTPAFSGANITSNTIPWAALSNTGTKPYPIATKSGTYTITNADCVILADATSGAFALTLPASPATGESYFIKKIDSSANAVTINGNTKNIDGAASTTLPAQWNAIELVYNGTAWYIF